MKKMFFRSLAVAAVAAVAGYNVYQSGSVMNRLSDLALANVEALADGDVIDGNGNKCATLVTESKEVYQSGNTEIVYNYTQTLECEHGVGWECYRGFITIVRQGEKCNANCGTPIQVNCMY